MEAYVDIEKFLKTIEHPRVLGLLKAGKKEHMEQLRQGRLYCRGLSYYKSIENVKKSFYDKYENVMSVLQSDRVTIVIKGKELGAFTLTKETGLTDKVVVQSEDSVSAFCLSSIHAGVWAKSLFTDDQLDSFKQNLFNPLKTLNKYGDYVWVITDYKKFKERLTSACKSQKISIIKSGPISYINFEICHGNVPEKYVGFVKEMSHQLDREFRYCFRSNDNLPDPLIIDLGSLEDVSIVISLEECLSSLSVNFN